MAAEEEEYEVAAIILDPGSSTLKAGFSTENLPRAVFHSFVGRDKKKAMEASESLDASAAKTCASGGAGAGAMKADGGDDGGDSGGSDSDSAASGDGDGETLVFGDDASADRDNLLLSYPFSGGHIRNWDDLEAMWRYTFFDYLGVDPEEYNVFVTAQSSATNEEHEKVASLLFERFGVPAMYLHPSSVLTLYSVGHTTGLVVDAGGCGTRVVPVYEGYGIAAAEKNLSFGGRHLTSHFIRMLTERSYYMDTSAKEDIARDMKEHMCYVVNDFETRVRVEEAEQTEKTYTLPDGTTYTLGSECFRLPEAMFDPALMGKESEGVSEAVHSAVGACDMDLRKPFLKRIVVGGGSSLFPGFCERVQRDVEKMGAHGADVKVQHADDPILAVWHGASILCGLSTFDHMWLSAAEFEEYGPSAVLRKCAVA